MKKEIIKIQTMDMNQVFFLKRLSKLVECLFESVPNLHKGGYTLVRLKKDVGIPYKDLENIKNKFYTKYGKELIIENENIFGTYSYSLTIKK